MDGAVDAGDLVLLADPEADGLLDREADDQRKDEGERQDGEGTDDLTPELVEPPAVEEAFDAGGGVCGRALSTTAGVCTGGSTSLADLEGGTEPVPSFSCGIAAGDGSDTGSFCLAWASLEVSKKAPKASVRTTTKARVLRLSV